MGESAQQRKEQTMTDVDLVRLEAKVTALLPREDLDRNRVAEVFRLADEYLRSLRRNDVDRQMAGWKHVQGMRVQYPDRRK